MERNQSQPAAERATPDALDRHWVNRLPLAWRPYARLARLDRPIGTWLLFWPSAAGAALAGGGTAHIALFLLLGLGSVAMRGAGCTYNDIIDRDLDARVARTRNRPLASGAIRLRSAWAFLVALCLVGLCVLLVLNPAAQRVALASLLLVAGYPFMKRITWWPQAWLGLTYNWGALVGWTAVTGSIGWPALLLYGAGLFWTLGYDTIYALQDIEDDAIVGIRSSARRLGQHVQKGVALFYLGAILCLAAALAMIAPWAALYALLPAAHFIWQVRQLSGCNEARALQLFRSNTICGLLIFLACALTAI